MQEVDKLYRSKILMSIAISSILLMSVARIWQFLAHINLAPILWRSGDIVLAISLASILFGLSTLLYRFWPLYHRSVDAYIEPVVANLGWWDLIWLGLLPGIAEELLFRGIMLPAFGSNLLAVFCSSLIFGILHLRSWQYWPYFLIATLMSIVLAYTMILSKNLLVPILTHILLNLVSCLFWKYQKTKVL